MKKAGAKNDGAWFRANKAIMAMDSTQRATLSSLITDNCPTIEALFNDLQSLAAEAGLNESSGIPETLSDWLGSLLSKGIPRQIWWGKLTTTSYTRVDGDTIGTYEYIPNYSGNILQAAKELRRVVRNFIFALRESGDVFNLDTFNPGKLPNVDPLTVARPVKKVIDRKLKRDI